MIPNNACFDQSGQLRGQVNRILNLGEGCSIDEIRGGFILSTVVHSCDVCATQRSRQYKFIDFLWDVRLIKRGLLNGYDFARFSVEGLV